MKKVIAKRALCIMTIMLIVGLILILSSAAIGNRMGSNAIQRNGGLMDTSQYERIIDTNTSNFRTVGLILSLVLEVAIQWETQHP